MDQAQTREWIARLIQEDNLHEFYTSSEWLKLRGEILRGDRHECQRCKQLGLFERANTVHHVMPLRQHPELALSKFYYIDGKQHRNLISLSHDCHEIEDAAHVQRKMKVGKPLTEERW